MSIAEYDLVVIGSGPAGQKAAINAAKLRKRAAIIERTNMTGGVCVHQGTIPSKTIREAILHLTGFSERTFYGRDYRIKDNISVQDLAVRVTALVSRETGVIRAQLRRNGVAVIEGTAKFVDPHTIEVTGTGDTQKISGDSFVIACGTRPAHNSEIPFDGVRILDTDQLIDIPTVPRELIVVGAGVVGLEYCSFFAALGVKVTLIDQRPRLLDYVDHEIVEALSYHLRQLGTTFRLGERVTSIGSSAERDKVFAELESGKRVHGDALLYAVGRQGNADLLNLPAAGLESDGRGKLEVNEFFQTAVSHIYAAGDVIGFPALASTSMEQGRAASCHIFGAPFEHLPQLFPYGIYTIPEISMVGQTEEKLTNDKVPYEVGIARYSELAKSMMLGDEDGMLKVLFDRETLKLLGVHAIGERATEIIHIGQAVLSYGGTIRYFRDTVFNYPTLAEAYKVAALDGLNKL
ncbi:MAG TPA: Si-specific NAD(P)(+) transhydrogenase [Candidatus Acidoferrales bacterium]|nr:Si-specific NAD(P)(+) transhydrogenase [Candidatus Acidoferrales bacterium]